MIYSKLINIVKEAIYPISLYARQIAGTLVIFLIARYLTVYDFGLFSSYKNIATYCFVLANLNYNDYILVSTKAEPSKVRQKTGLFMVHAIILGIVYALISQFCPLENHFLFILIIARTFFDAVFFWLILPYFQATKKFTTIGYINIFYAIGIAIIAVLSFILKLSLIKFLILNIILGFINFIQCSYYIKIDYFGVILKIKKYLQLLDKKIWGYIGSSITVNLYTPLPALFVSTMIPKEQAALFFAGFTIATIPSLLINAQNQKVTPMLIKANVDEIKLIMKNNLIFILSVTGLMLLFMAIFGKLVLVLFYGQKYYENAYLILLMLMLGNILYGVAANYSIHITASGNQAAKIPMQIELIICSIATLFLFSRFGIYGAAISVLITMTYMVIRYKIFSDNWLKSRTN